MRPQPIVVVLLAASLAACADDLLPSPYRVIPAEQNGWELLVTAAQLVTDDDTVPLYPRTEPWDYPDRWTPSRPGVLRHLEVNAVAVAAFDQAVARPAIEPPAAWADDHWTGRHFQLIPKWRELARIKIQHAYLRQSQGDRSGALREVDDLLRFVDLRAAGAGDLVDYLVAKAIDRMALDALTTLLGPPLSQLDPASCEPTVCWPVTPLAPDEEALLGGIVRRLSDERNALPSLRRALAGDLDGLRRTLTTPDLYEGPMPSQADVAQALAYRRRVNLAVLAAAEQPAWRRVGRSATSQPVPALLRQPSWADAMLWAAPVENDRSALPDAFLAQRRVTATAIALRLYTARHSRLPGSLANLVSDGLLPTPPIDPHDGQPLRYVPSRGLVYSVGHDRRDDQGDRNLDQTAPLEFVVAPQRHQAAPWAEEPIPRQWHGSRGAMSLH